jgi:hypothetical protein
MHGRTGSENPNASLSKIEARNAKWYAKNSKLKLSEIGSIFGVNKSTIGRIARGDSWPNLSPKPPADNGQLRLPLGAT